MDFLGVFQSTFMQIWGLMETPLHFPDPIGTITPFAIVSFYCVAHILAEFVNRVSTRKGDDT